MSCTVCLQHTECRVSVWCLLYQKWLTKWNLGASQSQQGQSACHIIYIAYTQGEVAGEGSVLLPSVDITETEGLPHSQRNVIMLFVPFQRKKNKTTQISVNILTYCENAYLGIFGAKPSLTTRNSLYTPKKQKGSTTNVF